MSEHITHCEDKLVRGHRGTVAYCSCGWQDAWGLRDGSAEASAHGHCMNFNREYRRDYTERVAEYNSELEVSGCICEKFTAGYGYVLDPDCPLHLRRYSQSPNWGGCHDCSCHVNPPCGSCENCAHPDIDDCPNNCQECEIDHYV